MPMTRSKAMAFAGQTCKGVDTRLLVSLSSILSTRTAIPTLQVRSSYSAGTLAAAHNLEDCYPTIVSLHELHAGPRTPAQLKDILDMGGLSIRSP
eukprot:552587-Pyramimonas_sp.AAC.1